MGAILSLILDCKENEIYDLNLTHIFSFFLEYCHQSFRGLAQRKEVAFIFSCSFLLIFVVS